MTFGATRTTGHKFSRGKVLPINSVGTDAAFPGIYEDAATLPALEIEFGVKKGENIICSVPLCLKIFPHNDTSRLRDN